jgi:6-phosphogluconolactonase
MLRLVEPGAELRCSRLLMHDSGHNPIRSHLGYLGVGSQMSFLRAASAALIDQTCFRRILSGAVIVLAGASLSCINNASVATTANHSAFVTLPATGNVLLLNINGATGTVTVGPRTPITENVTPRGLALHPSKKFLYVANALANTISIFNVGASGILTLSGTPTPAGNGPNAAVIDPSGTYLLVTNVYGSNGSGGDISVYAMDSGTGALTEVAGSPFPANTGPTAIQFTHSGSFVYVTNPNIGMVTGFSFSKSSGALTSVPGSPLISGAGASALAIDVDDQYLYVANPSAVNPSPNQSTVGNISGFTINSTTGALTPMQGSPFTASEGNGPTALTVAPGGSGFLYAVTPGTSYSIWGFSITHGTGQLVALPNSPFSLSAGGLFAVVDPVGNFLYTGSQSGNGLSGYTYDLSTGAPTIIGGAPFSTGSAPGAMVFLE